MCSTRKSKTAGLRLACGAALALAGLAGGCQWAGPPPTERVNTTPVVIDEAMQRRDWDQSVAYYQNGAVVAGPTATYLRPDPELPELAQGALETPLFVANVVIFPFTWVAAPPWADVVYRGMNLEPTYTAAPPTNTTY